MRSASIALLLCALVAGCTSASFTEPTTSATVEPGATPSPQPAAPAPTAPAASSPSAPSPSRVEATQDGFVVKLQDFAMSPGWVEAVVGDKVTWRNVDGTMHTVTADLNATFDSGPLAAGESFEFVFDTAGTYGYHCNVHPGMRGTIRVS